MQQEKKSPDLNYFLNPGYIYLATRPGTISTVLGSGVSVCIYDQKRKLGGMNHFQLPFISDKRQATALFGNVATLTLIRMLIHDGSDPKHLEAQILGGASNGAAEPQPIGRENVRVARSILKREKIPIVSEDAGGKKGRKVVFTTATNEMAVIKVDKIRSGDWYPYDRKR